MSSPQPLPHLSKEESIRLAVWDAVKSLRFGSVEIVVHDGRVIQVEKREKTRFEQEGKS